MERIRNQDTEEKVRVKGESGRERNGVRKKEKRKLGRKGGREGGNARELCEGTRLKRTEQSRAKQSYFT